MIHLVYTNKDHMAEQDQSLTNRDNVHEFKGLHLEIKLLADQVSKLQAKVEKYEKDRESLLIWGILGLGAALLGLVGWIAKLLPWGVK